MGNGSWGMIIGTLCHSFKFKIPSFPSSFLPFLPFPLSFFLTPSVLVIFLQLRRVFEFCWSLRCSAAAQTSAHYHIIEAKQSKAEYLPDYLTT
ncbi:hypothetical protein EYC80_001292 [Monilinia laxa]|uniref:Uncharacterized protein n=1 Tax=Monilinia laxa TaxID=61186 RepID=A0A5N6K8U7_MONLA|nr:hypothetical protein EYC80_001292 [Monilinia laxa]